MIHLSIQVVETCCCRADEPIREARDEWMAAMPPSCAPISLTNESRKEKTFCPSDELQWLFNVDTLIRFECGTSVCLREYFTAAERRINATPSSLVTALIHARISHSACATLDKFTPAPSPPLCLHICIRLLVPRLRSRRDSRYSAGFDYGTPAK